MPDSLISTLPETTRRELSICGITTDAQLERTAPARIWQDLQTARRFFPDESFALTLQDIEKIVATLHRKETGRKEQVSPPQAAVAPHAEETDFRHSLQTAGQSRRKSRRNNYITHRAPLLSFLGAITALLMPMFFLALIGAGYLLLFTDERPLGNNPYIYMAAPLVFLIPHLLMVRFARCSVCHMPLFAYKPYSHHKRAHHIPLLGVAFSTALHVLFLLRFRCPACGTAQRLYGSPRSRQSVK